MLTIREIELIDEKGTSPKAAAGSVRESEFACCESGRRVIVLMR